MFLEQIEYSKIPERILYKYSVYLYSDNKEITTFGIQADVLLRCNDNKHCFITKKRIVKDSR